MNTYLMKLIRYILERLDEKSTIFGLLGFLINRYNMPVDQVQQLAQIGVDLVTFLLMILPDKSIFFKNDSK